MQWISFEILTSHHFVISETFNSFSRYNDSTTVDNIGSFLYYIAIIILLLMVSLICMLFSIFIDG